MADLPDISPDFSQPLPQVDPNSDLVPYRMSRTDPGMQEVVTTGYGPRARPPIQPPQGGGIGAPDMTGFLGEALQHLPVDEALRATAAASQYIAQRGYQRDVQSGMEAPKALLKWLPVMRNPTGLSEALQFQQAQMKAKQPTIHTAGGRLYRVPQAGQAEAITPEPAPKPPKLHFNNTTGEVVQENPDGTLKIVRQGTVKPPPMSPQDRSELTDAYRELNEGRKDMAKLVANPPTKNSSANEKKKHQDAMNDATMRMRDARESIFKLNPSSRPLRPDQSTSPFHTDVAAPPPQPNPAQTAPPVPPLKAQRKVGTTYTTPKGLYTWTENGWVKADNAK